MIIIILNSLLTKRKIAGNTSKGDPVPRKGENVMVGFTPPPFVDRVIYNYGENEVYVVIDSPFMED